jgi:ABC-type antimicrobial peptide transport system permease subunit
VLIPNGVGHKNLNPAPDNSAQIALKSVNSPTNHDLERHSECGSVLASTTVSILASTDDSDVPITGAQSLRASLDSHFAAVRAARTMLMTFGTLALGLSTIGLYAALAFAVGERTREIAVRLARGASRADVGGLVFRRGMAIVSLRIAAGVAACVIAGPFLATCSMASARVIL